MVVGAQPGLAFFIGIQNKHKQNKTYIYVYIEIYTGVFLLLFFSYYSYQCYQERLPWTYLVTRKPRGEQSGGLNRYHVIKQLATAYPSVLLFNRRLSS